MTDCPFCAIVRNHDEVDGGVLTYDDAIAFKPLNPVTPGHMLIVPTEHVAHAADDPEVTAKVMRAAAMYAREHFESFNIITSANRAATQTVFHLHLHVVPRRFGDGLSLPWTDR